MLCPRVSPRLHQVPAVGSRRIWFLMKPQSWQSASPSSSDCLVLTIQNELIQHVSLQVFGAQLHYRRCMCVCVLGGGDHPSISTSSPSGNKVFEKRASVSVSEPLEEAWEQSVQERSWKALQQKKSRRGFSQGSTAPPKGARESSERAHFFLLN